MGIGKKAGGFIVSSRRARAQDLLLLENNAMDKPLRASQTGEGK